MVETEEPEAGFVRTGGLERQERETAAIKEKKALKRKKQQEAAQRVAKFSRGEALSVKDMQDTKLRGQLQYNDRLAKDAAESAAKVDDWLLTENAGALEAEGMERTWRFAQEDIVREVETGAAAKVFDLNLKDLGPYRVDFTRSGRYLALAGRKGHLALMDWQRTHLIAELQVKETTRDVKFLHNETFFATAQRKYCYIYDKRGIEIHCLKEHTGVRRLEFLPYHFLLASVGDAGVLKYQDTSTGELVAQLSTKLGSCDVLRQNPWNACLCLGHANGVVTMWSPNIGQPLVKMLSHKGGVKAIAVDQTGNHMATSGVDSVVKIWDIRTFKPLHTYFSHAPATNLEISQKGHLAVGFGRRIQVWKDALSCKQQSPYMNHSVPAAASNFKFCPYEDILGIGHGEGLSTMMIPGSGEPNFDSWVADPYQAKRARREQEVRQLLDKLKPEMIVLDPSSLGQIRKEPEEIADERRAMAKEANALRRKKMEEKNEGKAKMKGKNKPSRIHKKKQSNVVEAKKGDLRERIQQELKVTQKKSVTEIPDSVPRALRRFYKNVKA